MIVCPADAAPHKSHRKKIHTISYENQNRKQVFARIGYSSVLQRALQQAYDHEVKQFQKHESATTVNIRFIHALLNANVDRSLQERPLIIEPLESPK